jgi:D-serine deaminase-like pyridoxal phosphate-dependent protein
MIERLHNYIREAYASSIGKSRQEITTPALLLDLEVAKRNIDFMAERLSGMPADLRPHIKVQKCPELAKLQIDAGAIGVCTATVWEAIVMSRSGIEDVLIANEVQGTEKMRVLAKQALQGTIRVAVDDEENAMELSEAAAAAGSDIGVLIEVDVGMGRGGVRTVEDAVVLARRLENLPNLRFEGVQGYEGHCMLEPDRELRIKKARAAMDHVGEVVQRLREAGFDCRILSAGGTGTYDITGADPRVTEIQAGSYVFMDNFHGTLVPGFSRSLTVLSTVMIKHGNTIVMDAGRKSIGIDFVQPTMAAYPEYQARYFAEEHALFDVDDHCPLRRGDTVEFIPGYAPTTVNLYDAFHVIEDNVVTDIWPIIPRGPGHLGILARHTH